LIGGRQLPARPVVVAASLGAAMLTAIWLFALVSYLEDSNLRFSSTGAELLFFACYTPNLLWGPMLGAVTYAYWRRRRSG
jgi:hypothetical protein